MRIGGHGLQHEGHPFGSAGCVQCQETYGEEMARQGLLDRTSWRLWYAKAGHGLCSCGWTTEHLPSTAARKRAYRDHQVSVMFSATQKPTPQ